jgi:hypothetical protein
VRIKRYESMVEYLHLVGHDHAEVLGDPGRMRIEDTWVLHGGTNCGRVVDVEHPIPYSQGLEDAPEASGRCGYALQHRNWRPDLKGMVA